MKLKLWLTSLAVLPMLATAQLNVELLSNLDYEPILNDIWGYVDKDSTEYALVGMTTGVSIVSLEDPTDPREVQFIKGTNSTWRDLKIWGDFMYVVADQGQDGLLIVDLSTLPNDTAAYSFWKPEIDGAGTLQRSHNIWIDEFGLAYLAGSNIGGTTIFDVKADPWVPVYLGKMPYDYAHDVYVRDSLVYAAEIYLGHLSVYDISDLSDIRQLGFVTTPHAFTHNTWTSDDGKTCFTTDERSNAYVGSYDVSNPAEIKELDRFRPAKTTGQNVIPHNVHVWNDYLIVSYYTDGCILVDAARPDNLIEVGNFDTYIGASGGYNGAWGAYPFLPSGNILISDRQTGLYVLGPDYKRGCYFEGNVVNKVTMGAVGNAKVEILLEPGDDTEVLLPTSTGPSGEFKTGKAVAGTFMVRCTHPDYYPFEGEFQFENGVLLETTIELQPKEQFSVSGRVVEIGTAEMVPFANVVVQDPFHLFQTQADANGQFMFPAVFEGSYKIYAGNWGQYGIVEADIHGNFTDDVFVQHGYYDDFLYNYGWTVTGANEDAEWVRAVPVSELLFSQYQCNPAVDIDDDFGGHAFVTGNAGGNAANDGVINGTSILNSPIMDLTAFGEPILQYRPWICQRFDAELSYFVLLSNGTDTLVIDTVRSLNGIAGSWQTSDEFDLLSLMPITDQMQVHFVAAEDTSVENVVKAGLDVFTVIDALASSVKPGPGAIGSLRMYPNPASDVLRIDLSEMAENPDRLTLVDLFGRRVVEQNVTGTMNTISLLNLASGVYVVHASVNGQIVAIGKVVVQ